jgi:hypothetical protein
MEYLDFELPIKELEDQLDKCQIIGAESNVDVTATCKQIEKKLEDDKIIKLIPMAEFLKLKGKVSDFTNEVYFAELKSGLKAVFTAVPAKPQIL